jgi:Methylamine utilisation protein MauE
MTDQLSYALQLSLGVVFTAAALPKLRHPAAFARTVAGYRLLPRAPTGVLAFTVIAIESFLAVAFPTGWAIPIALPLAAVILTSFAVAVAINLRRGRRIPCGCFGGESEALSGRSLARLATLLGGVLLLAALGRSPLTAGKLASEGTSALAYLVQIGGVSAFLVLGVAWLLSLPELAFVLRRLVSEGRA